MTAIIRLAFTNKGHAIAAVPEIANGRRETGYIAPGKTRKLIYPEQHFINCLVGIENIIRHGNVDVRLIHEETGDIDSTLSFIKNLSPVIYEHILLHLPDSNERCHAIIQDNSTQKDNMMNKQIFVSYAHPDLEPARKIVSFLKGAGFSTWFDKDNLLGGQEWEKIIPKEIQKSVLFLLCFSSQSVNKKGFVQKEIKLALDEASKYPPNQIYIMPIRLDCCDIPDDISRYHVIDLYDLDGVDKLLKSVNHAIKEQGIAPSQQKELLINAVKLIQTSSSTLTHHLSKTNAFDQFVEMSGVLWKKNNIGVYESIIYCPSCQLAMSVFPPGSNEMIVCSKCHFIAPFRPNELKDKTNELPK